MRLIALLPMLARVQLVVLGMILLLLPTVALLAPVLVGTSIFVVVYELAGSPVEALILRVYVELGLSSEVLPIMRVDTLVPLMIVFIVGTPNSLEVEHVEVRVLLQLINELD